MIIGQDHLATLIQSGDNRNWKAKALITMPRTDTPGNAMLAYVESVQFGIGKAFPQLVFPRLG